MMPKKKKEEAKPIIVPSQTRNDKKIPYKDIFTHNNGQLIPKRDVIIGGNIYKKGEIIENTQWGKYDLTNDKLQPITIITKKMLEIKGFG